VVVVPVEVERVVTVGVTAVRVVPVETEPQSGGGRRHRRLWWCQSRQ